MYIYSWEEEKKDKSWSILVMFYVKSRIFLHVKCLHMVIQLYNGVTSPCFLFMLNMWYKLTLVWIIGQLQNKKTLNTQSW